MPLIQQKKQIYDLDESFQAYLATYGRLRELPLRYRDLLRYEGRVSLYDKAGRDTLWYTLLYPQSEIAELHEALRRIYAELKASGDEALMRHLYIERIDVCDYGNTTPFRVKIVNRFNENFDYFYVKRADASRVLGLELEHLLSPSRINYICDGHTLVEEHIPGIPGEVFIEKHLSAPYINDIRLAKEFVKFNERCLVRLLGDMHCHNFVVEMTPDFEDTIYRIRAIDFDQQSYEGNLKVYLPQFHKENNPIIRLGMPLMTPESTRQYQNEERAGMRYRYQSQRPQLEALLAAVAPTPLAPPENVAALGAALAKHYGEPAFAEAPTMGALLGLSLAHLAAEAA